MLGRRCVISRDFLMPLARVVPLLVCTMLSGCFTIDVGSVLDPQLQELTIGEGRRSAGKILVVDISGVVRNGEEQDLFAHYTTPAGIKKQLNKAERDSAIRAVILRINSPGGGVTASDLVYHEIMAFKRRTGIPVYATTLTVAASGGYYIAMAADEVYAAPTSIIGSIGVIARFPDVSGLADKVGYSERIFKSGENKDLGHPLREINPEQAAIFQHMIDAMYDRFLDVIVSSRPAIASRQQLRPIADGRIYTPRQAQRNGLIDGIHYIDEVVAKIKADRGLDDAELILYGRGRSADANIYSRFNPEINILNVDLSSLLGPAEPGLQYLWMPVANGG